MFRVTKTYGHELGLSCAFRQWRAESHCAQIHGYALRFDLTFEAADLNDCGWVIDFGSLKPIKEMLAEHFDHVFAVAKDDPALGAFMKLHEAKVANVRIFDHGVGCERFADFVFRWVEAWLADQQFSNRPRLASVDCREHGSNSAGRSW